jgi:hypothetical protein
MRFWGIRPRLARFQNKRPWETTKILSSRKNQVSGSKSEYKRLILDLKGTFSDIETSHIVTFFANLHRPLEGSLGCSRPPNLSFSFLGMYMIVIYHCPSSAMSASVRNGRLRVPYMDIPTRIMMRYIVPRVDIAYTSDSLCIDRRTADISSCMFQ